MQTERQQNTNTKRILGKVRRSLVHKKNEDENTLVDPAARYIPDNNVYTLSPVVGLVEINRRIYSGPQYLNPYFKISDLAIQDYPLSKKLVLSFGKHQNSNSIPWEYTMKRLESFGDLELATWAHRIKKYNTNYSESISDFLKLTNMTDPKVATTLKSKAQRCCEEIESKYEYYKVSHYYGLDSSTLSEISYSEGFLNEMGYSLENFVEWIRQHGLPSVFDHSCLVYIEIIKAFFDCSAFSDNFDSKGAEYETVLVDSKGTRKSVRVQTVYVVQPAPQGFLMSGYFILKDKKPKMEIETSPEKPTVNFFKHMKVENTIYEIEKEEIMVNDTAGKGFDW